MENKSFGIYVTMQQKDDSNRDVETLSSRFDQKRRMSNLTSNETELRLRQDQRLRIRHLRDCCAKLDPFTVYRQRIKERYYFSSRYNITYCKVLKVGSTFFTQMFSILQDGVNSAEKIFDMERDKVHIVQRLFLELAYNSDERRNSRTILVARDPYTRLFSAFVDKFYLPLAYYAAKAVLIRQRNIILLDNSHLCTTDVTFEEFLDDIVYCHKHNIPINGHWAPVTLRCNVCDLDVFTIVKQETFADDVEFTLKEMGVIGAEYDLLHHALYDKRTNVTVPGLIKTVLAFNLEENYGEMYCLSDIEVAKRLWKSLQIQGYLRNDVMFPYDVINDTQSATDASLIEDVVMRALRDNPMTSEEKQRQRRHALEQAYRDVSLSTIRNIQYVYRYDFKYFNYSLEPPYGTKRR